MKKVKFIHWRTHITGTDGKFIAVDVGHASHVEVSSYETTVYLIDGCLKPEGGKIIALDGIVECTGYTKVYTLDAKVKCVQGEADVEKIKVIKSQKEWDKIAEGEYEVIAIDGDVELNIQKVPHIVVLDGNIIVNEGVSIFVVRGRVTCLGGEVIAWDGLNDKDLRIDDDEFENEEFEGEEIDDYGIRIVLVDGKVYQKGGILRVIKGEFETPFLKQLIIENPVESKAWNLNGRVQ